MQGKTNLSALHVEQGAEREILMKIKRNGYSLCVCSSQVTQQKVCQSFARASASQPLLCARMTILVARVVCIARARRNMGKLTDAMKVFVRVERCDAAEWVLLNREDSPSILELRFVAEIRIR